MRRNSSTGDEARALERRYKSLSWQDKVRYLNLLRRMQGDLEGVFGLYFSIANEFPEVTERRAEALRVLHAAGFSHPDPEVILMLTPFERRLAVWTATLNYRELSEAWDQRWDFSERERIVHGDTQTDLLVATSNRGEYQGEAGLEKALEEASELERGYGPIVLLRQRPWGKPAPSGYKTWFTEHSLFLDPNKPGHVKRYLHFVGEHQNRKAEKGVIALDYRHRIHHDSGFVPADTETLIWAARLQAKVAKFEIELVRLLDEKGARAANIRGGSGASWQNAAGVIHELLRELTDEHNHTDFYLSPSVAPTATWRGSRRWSDPVATYGFVLGVFRGHFESLEDVKLEAVSEVKVGSRITLGVGSVKLERRQTSIRPDHVWLPLAPWPGRSVDKLTRRLETWAGELDDSKVELDLETAEAWLRVLRDPLYNTGHYP